MKKFFMFATAFICCFSFLSAGSREVLDRDKQLVESEKKKALAGRPLSQYFIGRAYIEGEAGLDVDKQEGLYWITKAANNKYLDAQEYLANYYLEQGDFFKCREWSWPAAEQGSVEAMKLLGKCYLQNKDSRVEVSIVEGLKWIILAASGGDKGCKEMLVNLEDEEELFNHKEYSQALKRAQTWLKLNDHIKIKISPEYLNTR